jgi:hypothetical protein
MRCGSYSDIADFSGLATFGHDQIETLVVFHRLVMSQLRGAAPRMPMCVAH